MTLNAVSVRDPQDRLDAAVSLLSAPATEWSLAKMLLSHSASFYRPVHRSSLTKFFSSRLANMGISMTRQKRVKPKVDAHNTQPRTAKALQKVRILCMEMCGRD